ncbi:MAG: NAD-dependent DNA ligase LigA, partial [Christensenellaceae bacterium]|nr:NAD-dependent DNA ligase LigA [Christensenellaceae bacterium]
NIAELYELSREQLMTLPGFKEKRADNIITSIENSKHPELAEFVFALGINNVGKKTAKDLAERYGTFERIKKATLEELVEMRDIGEVVAECIVDFFQREQVIATLDRLEKNGVCPKDFVKAEGVFSGKNVVITGTLENYKRAEAQAVVEAQGGTVQSAVAKTTDYLIAGEKAGSKLAKAEKLGIAILSEQQFIEMIN